MGRYMEKGAPSPSGVRDPRDPKMKNGMFNNPPRYLYFGGVPRAGMNGEKGPNVRPTSSKVGPISDRGKGGRGAGVSRS